MQERPEGTKSSRSYLNTVALMIVVFVSGTLFGANVRNFGQQLGFNIVTGPFDKLETIYRLVQTYHVDPAVLESPDAIDDAIRGFLVQVDGGYTRYETPNEVREFNQSQLEGTYTGIGIQSIYRPNEMEVEIVFRGSPAEKAGVRVRDRVIAVDGESIKGLTQSEINTRIRGEAGTQVAITILRDGEPTPLVFNITRGVIALPVVDHWVDGHVGVVAMYRFTETAPGQLREAILDLKGKGVEAILFDLRSNGGGLLFSAQQIVDFFVPKEHVIVRQVDRFGREQVLYTEEATIWDGPLAVLLNGASASASEVVAGALQDHERAVVLGEQSFGKGTVQVPYQLTDGSRLWVTQYRYLTPDGRDINQKGLVPDQIIELPDDARTDTQLKEAVDYVQNNLIRR